jgi:3-oxoacyl-[acyl-carrier-protein] synthase II
VPPTANLADNLDPACAGVHHVTAGCQQTLRTALSNSFAFGGSNAVLAFRAVAP